MLVVSGVSALLALVAGRGAGTIWVFAAVCAGQAFLGWSNDYLDREHDRGANRQDKPVATGEVGPEVVRRAAIVAMVVTIPLSFASGILAALVHFAGLASGMAYNLGLKATALSVVPYAVSFSLVPAFVTLGLTHSHWPPLWVCASAGLIGVGGHFAQARPDVAVDRRQNLHGMPERMGDRGSGIAAAVFLAAASILIAASGKSALPLVALIPAAGAAIAGPRLGFWLTVATAVLTAAAFVLTASAALR